MGPQTVSSGPTPSEAPTSPDPGYCYNHGKPVGPALTPQRQRHGQSVQDVVHSPAFQVYWEVIVGLSLRGENRVAGSRTDP